MWHSWIPNWDRVNFCWGRALLLLILMKRGEGIRWLGGRGLGGLDFHAKHCLLSISFLSARIWGLVLFLPESRALMGLILVVPFGISYNLGQSDHIHSRFETWRETIHSPVVGCGTNYLPIVLMLWVNRLLDPPLHRFVHTRINLLVPHGLWFFLVSFQLLSWTHHSSSG